MARKAIPSSSEFKRFVRDLGIRAFDQLTSRLEPDSSAATPGTRRTPGAAIGKLAGTWSSMGKREKERFFDQLFAAAQEAASGPPLPSPARTEKVKNKPPVGNPLIARAEATLPPEKGRGRKIKGVPAKKKAKTKEEEKVTGQ